MNSLFVIPCCSPLSKSGLGIPYEPGKPTVQVEEVSAALRALMTAKTAEMGIQGSLLWIP